MGKPCPDCGGHSWAAAGYCLEIKCAGHYLDKDYPRSKKKLEDNRSSENKLVKYKEARPPRTEQARLEAERYYESIGKKAPWIP